MIFVKIVLQKLKKPQQLYQLLSWSAWKKRDWQKYGENSYLF